MGAVWGKITSSVCKCDAKPPNSSINNTVPGSATNNNNNRPKNNARPKPKPRNKNNTKSPFYTGN